MKRMIRASATLSTIRRSKSPKNLLKYAEENAGWGHRSEALENKYFPQEYVDQYVDDEDKFVRRAVAYRTKDPKVHAKLLKDPYFEVRIWALYNPMTTNDQLLYSADNDETNVVRTRAQQIINERNGVKEEKRRSAPAFDSYDEAMDSYFLEIENSVFYQLGIYADFSAVRGNSGPVSFYSDPNHDNDSDMWFGEDDALLASIDFSEYEEGLYNRVWIYPKNKMKDAFKSYIQDLIS